MMFKTLSVVALLVAAAATCTDDSCATEQEETSLVQVKSVVRHRNERIPNEAADWPTPVHDWDAVTDSTPDHLDDGEVMDSFSKNADKVRNEIEEAAAGRIDFTNGERTKRRSSYHEAADAVNSDKKQTDEAIAADKAAVAKTKKVREEVVEAAKSRVKASKENAAAHHIKAAQADHAAALGRKVGTIEGADASHHAWADYAAEVKTEHDAAALKVARDNIAAHQAKVEKGVAAKTAAMAKADDAWVARANRAATVAQAHAAAAAAKEEVDIEGPEGLKNRMTDVKADWSTLHYDRRTDASQADVDGDAAGSIGIHQSYEDSAAAGPGEAVPSGLEFSAPEEGLASTAFQEALAGASLAEIPNEADDWETPVHDDDAVTDSTPDHLDDGQVMDAFATNADKVRDEIEGAAAHRIDFTDSQRAERRAKYKHAQEDVAADKKATEEAIAADKAAVAKTKKVRQEAKAAAAARVKAAKQAARAHAIKAAQADHAAALGRKVGTTEGADASHHAWKDYKAEVKAEHAKAALKVARDNIAAHEAKVEKSVADKTAAMSNADAAWVARADRAATVAKARAAAAAAKEEVEIEGAEGIKNRMTDVKADWAEKHYSRRTDASQEDIDADAAGSIDIDQSWTDTHAAGPNDAVPTGEEFSSPDDGLATTDFQEALAES